MTLDPPRSGGEGEGHSKTPKPYDRAGPQPKPDTNAVAASPPPAHTETTSPATAPKTARTPGSPTMRTLHDLHDEMLAVVHGTRPIPPVRIAKKLALNTTAPNIENQNHSIALSSEHPCLPHHIDIALLQENRLKGE